MSQGPYKRSLRVGFLALPPPIPSKMFGLPGKIFLKKSSEKIV